MIKRDQFNIFCHKRKVTIFLLPYIILDLSVISGFPFLIFTVFFYQAQNAYLILDTVFLQYMFVFSTHNLMVNIQIFPMQQLFLTYIYIYIIFSSLYLLTFPDDNVKILAVCLSES